MKQKFKKRVSPYKPIGFRTSNYGAFNLAILKKLVKVFETEEQRDQWIKDQNYYYDRSI